MNERIESTRQIAYCRDRAAERHLRFGRYDRGESAGCEPDPSEGEIERPGQAAQRRSEADG